MQLYYSPFGNSLHLKSVLRGNQSINEWCKSTDWFLRKKDFKCKEFPNGPKKINFFRIVFHGFWYNNKLIIFIKYLKKTNCEGHDLK